MTFLISDTPQSASLVKLAGNFLAASVIESLGEAMALVDKGGVDQRAFLDLLTSTMFAAPVYKSSDNPHDVFPSKQDVARAAKPHAQPKARRSAAYLQ